MRNFLRRVRRPAFWKKFAIRSGIGLFGLLVLVAGSAEFTSRPNFCTTCHYMEPYFASWDESDHSDVSCVTCHFPPGLEGTIRGKMEGLLQVANYMGGSYARRKPWAEIDDASCLQSGCHDSRLLEGEVDYNGVVFDHGDHLTELRRGKDLRCTSCHSQIVQGEHMVVTESTCFLCHFKQGGEVEPETFEKLSNCQTCHHWEDANNPDRELTEFHQNLSDRDVSCDKCHSQTLIGDGFVPRQNCFACHWDNERLDQIGETTLLHEKHIKENKIECVQCHLQIQHKLQRVDATAELRCESCHQSTHNEQVALFTGTVPNVESVPSPMFDAGLDCAGCHVFHGMDDGGTEGSQIARTQSCESCHGEGYDRLLELWQRSANVKLVDFERNVGRVDRAVRNASQARRDAATARLEAAKSLLHVVRVGKPVHNVAYYDQLIRNGYDDLQGAIDSVGARITLPSYSSTALVPGQCANCHTGVDEINTEFRGSTFSHQRHVADQQIECSTCHSNAAKHGQLLLTKKNCNSCHHTSQPETTCESCHTEAAEFYAGTYLDLDTPDYMFTEDITCDECHNSGSDLVRPDAAVCVDCHDDEYQQDALDWQTEVAELIRDIETLTNRSTASAATRAKPEYQQARTVLRDLAKGGAGGVHNYELISELLLDLKSKLED